MTRAESLSRGATVCGALLLLLLLSSTVVTSVSASAASAASSALVLEDDPLAGDPGRAQSCTPVPIEVPMCDNKYYNTTARTIPGVGKQSDAAHTLAQLADLVGVPCAPFMRLFVCSMHLPFCAGLLVRPCKEFCERIRDLCTPVLVEFGHQWPASLACEGLKPEREDDSAGGATAAAAAATAAATAGGKLPPKNLCLRPNGRDFEDELERMRSSGEMPDLKSAAAVRKLPQPLPPTPAKPPRQPWRPRLPPAGDTGDLPPPAAASVTTSPPADDTSDRRSQQQRRCTSAEVKLGHDPSGVACAQRCQASFLFSRDDKAFASVWMLIWSVVCFVCSALAVVTFAMDSGRFLFPERPIVWVATCYLLFSLGHILRVALGPEVACSQLDGPGTGPELYRVSRHAGHWCAVIFLMLYFSSLAGCMWWLMLTVCWYLCAARKWAHEALAHRTVWLHVFAWGVPLVLSVVLLVLHRIEADELTHLCVVDASDRSNLLIFSIAPTALCVVAGLCFLVSALCSSVSVRHSLKWSGNASFRRLEKLMTKIGLFSFLYVLPTVCVLAASAYEFLERGKWTASVEKLLARPACVNATGLLLTAGPERDSCQLDSRPSPAFYMLKIFMSLAAGLPAGMVVWFNCKSLNAWQACLAKALAPRRRQQQQPGDDEGVLPLGDSRHGQRRPASSKGPAAVGSGTGGGGGGGGRLMLLGSGQSKYPPISGIGATDI